MTKLWYLIIICLFISFYLEQTWLVVLLIIASVFMIVGSLPSKAKKPSARKEEEILHPVIYEDVGEPPYLYPPKFEVKVYPERWKKTGMEKVGYELGRVIGGFLGLFNKNGKKKK